MGAIVFATDVRMASKEQVESLGGKFLTVEGAENLETEGGYAKEASDDFKKKQEELLSETLKKIDIDGLDYYALKSCEKIIDKFKPKILIEISESSVRYHNISFLDVIEYLKQKNYECYYPNKNLIKFDKTYLEKDEVRNLYFK